MGVYLRIAVETARPTTLQASIPGQSGPISLVTASLRLHVTVGLQFHHANKSAILVALAIYLSPHYQLIAAAVTFSPPFLSAMMGPHGSFTG